MDRIELSLVGINLLADAASGQWEIHHENRMQGDTVMSHSAKRLVYTLLGIGVVLIAVWAAIYWGRGGAPRAPQVPSTPATANPSMDRVTVEKAITLWMAGDKEKAMQVVINGKADDKIAVSPTVQRTFSTRESDLKSLSQQELASIQKESLEISNAIRDLTQALLVKCRQATADEDLTRDKAIREKIREMGRELSKAESLAILRVVGNGAQRDAGRP